jgi:pyrroloquinoline-quinone synthase
MTTPLELALDAALTDHRLLEHPFYRRWEAGEVSRDELTRYAEQYRFFEAMFPKFLESLSQQLPDGAARDAVLDNLNDEVTAPSHLELFDRFASSFDATDAPISPAVAELVEAYARLLELGPRVSLAGLWAYETQGAEIAQSKADGLVTHYGASATAVEFWTVHGLVEGSHAQGTLEALTGLNIDPGEALLGAQLIGDAWWAFLDERELLAA